MHEGFQRPSKEFFRKNINKALDINITTEESTASSKSALRKIFYALADTDTSIDLNPEATGVPESNETTK